MYKKLMWTVAFTLSLLLSQAVLAHSSCGKGLQEMVASLKLDDAQKAKMKPIFDQLKSNLKDNWTQMKSLHDQITQQIQSDATDQSALDALIDKKTQLIGNMMKAKANASHQIYLLLTAKQKSQFQSNMKAMEEKMAEKFKGCHDDE